LKCGVRYLRGRKAYHLLFAVLLLIVACWDLGIFLVMIRNSDPGEVLLYQNVVTVPVLFFPGFAFHFTTSYLNQPRRKLTIAIYGYCAFALLLVLLSPASLARVASVAMSGATLQGLRLLQFR